MTCLSSIRQPSGVHGTKGGADPPGPPLHRRPVLITWKPSTSLAGLDGHQHRARVDLRRQRQLYQDAVHRRVVVEPADQRQQLGLADLGRQPVRERAHAGLGGLFGLGADIDLAGRALAHQDHRQAGLQAVVVLKGAATASATRARSPAANALPSIRAASGMAPTRCPAHSLEKYIRRGRRHARPCAGPAAPAVIVMAPFGTSQALDSSLINAAFALPPSGAAVTETFSAAAPSAPDTTPPMRFAAARGATRTATRTPSPTVVNGERGIGISCRRRDSVRPVLVQTGR